MRICGNTICPEPRRAVFKTGSNRADFEMGLSNLCQKHRGVSFWTSPPSIALRLRGPREGHVYDLVAATFRVNFATDGFAFAEVDDPLISPILLRFDFEAEEIGGGAAVDLGDVFLVGLPDEEFGTEFWGVVESNRRAFGEGEDGAVAEEE